MKDWKSLSHVRWECKYHIVFVSKYRHKRIYGKIREKIGDIIRDLCKQKGIELLEGHAMPGLSFWATGYCVSTVGLDEEMIRKYIRDQNDPDS